MPTFTVSIPGGRVGHFLAGAAVASVIGGAAVAVTSPDFTYSSVKAGRYSISPAAMIPRGNAGADAYNINASDLTASGCHVTGVNLPQGAVVVSVATWYQSNALSDLTVFLFRNNPSTGNTETVTSRSVNDNSNTRKMIAHTGPAPLGIIDNAKFNYSYWACIQDGTTFYGARINYTYKSAGD